MYNFAVVHRARSGAIAVDFFSSKRRTPCPWRTYWTVSPSSVARLRAAYAGGRKNVYVFQGWSELRVQAYKEYGQRAIAQGVALASFNSLSTSGRQG